MEPAKTADNAPAVSVEVCRNRHSRGRMLGFMMKKGVREQRKERSVEAGKTSSHLLGTQPDQQVVNDETVEMSRGSRRINFIDMKRKTRERLPSNRNLPMSHSSESSFFHVFF